MDGRNTKNKSLPLLNEKTIRTAMTHLHVSTMGATENAKTLLKRDPRLVTWKDAQGSKDAQQSLVNLCWWLDSLRHFSFGNQVFENQILLPIKLAAEFLIDVREQKSHTTKIRGLVFSKSRPYFDKHSENNRVTISMIVPSIQNVVSIRCSEESSNKIHLGKFYDFEQAKPLPLANRVHQSHPEIKECGNEKPILSDYSFLKISFDDVETMSRSIEMENFTEVASSQSELRHNLAAVLVISGKIVQVRGSRITLQNARENNTSTMLVSAQLYDSMSLDSLEKFNGKFVRVLVACWYDSGLEPEGHPQSLEVFYMENAASQSAVISDEIKGFVRLRGKVSKKTVEDRYPEAEVEKIKELLLEDGFLTLQKARPEEYILAKFVEVNSKIRDLRSSIKSEEIPSVKIEDILDPGKISSEMLLRKIKTDEQLQNMLLTILKMRDKLGILSTKKDLEQPSLDEESLRKMTWWLGFTGLILEDHESISLTSAGSDLLYILLKNRIKESVEKVRSSGIVSIPELEKLNIIPSLAVKYLREEGKDSGIASYLENGMRCELFWIDERSNDVEHSRMKAGQKIQELGNKVISVFREISHPLNTKKVIEELKKNNIELSHYSANLLMSTLRGKKLNVSGDSWIYDLETRVKDLLAQEPNEIFSTHTICERTSIPPVQIGKVRSFLNELGKEGLATEIRPDLWTASKNPMEKCRSFLKSLLKHNVTVLLEKNRLIDAKKLRGTIEYRARELCSTSIWKNAGKITDEVIAEMVSSKEIMAEDGMYGRSK